MYIYFIRESGQGLVKIGFTKQPESRLISLQNHTPHKLTLLGVVRGTRKHEARVHEHFQDSRVWGEWFKPTAELEEFIHGLKPWRVGAAPEDFPIFSGAKHNIFFDLYRAGYTQAQIASHFGFSRQRANQLIMEPGQRNLYPRSKLSGRAMRPKPSLPIDEYIERTGGMIYHPLAIES